MLETYTIPILFNPGDIVYNPKDKHYKKYIISIDKKKGLYKCDGCTFKIVEQFEYKKVTTLSDLFIGDIVRLKGDPNCYMIRDFLEDGMVKLYQIHGDSFCKIEPVNALLSESSHALNIKK